MTSKTTLSYLVTALLASILTAIFMNFNPPQPDPCTICKNRLRRSGEKIPFCKEQNKKQASKVKIEEVLLKNAVKDGAVCLDGSPASYHFREGFGNGVNKWIIFFNGGAWCYDEQACYQRSHGAYGSSRYKTTFSETGLYSRNREVNPYFYNWNMVFVIYCDGASFTGMRTNPVLFKNKPVYFRGKAILDAIIEDLLARGLGKASDVLLTGSSAGSLAVLIHADYIKAKLRAHTKVRALSDSGYFVDVQNQYGKNKTREMFRTMLATHNATAGLNQACLRRMAAGERWKCVFPQYFFDLIKTPVFVLQSAYDVWQIVTNLNVVCTIPSYRDMLLFSSLKRLRAPGGTRAHSTHTDVSRRRVISSRESGRARMLSSMLSRNVFSRASVPLRTSNAFYPSLFSRDSRVETPAYRQSVASHRKRSSTPENAHVIPVQSTQVVHRRNVLRTHTPSWYHPDTRLNTLFYSRNHDSKFSPEDSHEQNLVKTQILPFLNPRPSLPAWLPASADTARAFNAVPSSFAHLREKREPGKVEHVLPKLRSGDKMPKNSSVWHWQSLYHSPAACTKPEMEMILSLRRLTLDALQPVLNKHGSGLFLSSCFEHTQARYSRIWMNATIKGKSPRDAIADWYFGKSGDHRYIGQEFSFEFCMP